MAYRAVKRHKGKGWYIRFETWQGNTRSVKYIPKEEYGPLGVNLDSPIEEVRARLNVLNRSESLKTREGKRLEIKERMDQEGASQESFLPASDVKEFHEKYLAPRINQRKNKTLSHWRATKRVLCHLKQSVSDYHEFSTSFYSFFVERSWSMAYVQKVLPLINLWGHYQARKYKLPFLPLPSPRGVWRQRITDAFYDKVGDDGLASDPLTPGQLESKRSCLIPEQYNWLLLSIWFGLRPEEVDSLHLARSYRIEIVKDITFLQVYQTKLTSVSRSERWKPIPCHHSEQIQALDIIKEGKFKRPLAKTLRKYFTPRTTTYAGRKGFLDLMMSKGHTFDKASLWLGHTSLDRTWKDYKDRKKLENAA